MKFLSIVLVLLLTSAVFAGPGHGHSHDHSESSPAISKEKTLEIGKSHVERLIKEGKIDISWKEAKYDASEKKKFGHNTEWVVTYKNDKGVKGKILYIFLKESGEYVAANFTGK